jgi:hypothetical protein
MWAPVHSACNEKDNMTPAHKARAVLTDSHFLIPLAAFLIGLALLIALH